MAFNNNTVRTDCNHIFLNFVPTVVMDPSKVRFLVSCFPLSAWGVEAVSSPVLGTAAQTGSHPPRWLSDPVPSSAHPTLDRGWIWQLQRLLQLNFCVRPSLWAVCWGGAEVPRFAMIRAFCTDLDERAVHWRTRGWVAGFSPGQHAV